MLSLLVFATVQDSVSIESSAAEIEREAASVRRIYTAESWRRSVELYVEAADIHAREGNVDAQTIALLAAVPAEVSLGNPGDAQARLKALVTANQSTSVRARLLSELSRLALQLGNYQESEAYLQQAIKLADKSEDQQTIAEANFAATEFYYERQQLNDLHTANERALVGFRSTGDRVREAETLVSIAYAHMLERDYRAGLNAAIQARELSEQIGDTRGRINALIAIGNAKTTIGESRGAYRAYADADSLSPDGLDQTRKGQIANGLGAIYEKYSDWVRSLEYRRSALELYRRENNTAPQLYTLISAGRLSIRTGDRQAAESYFTDGEKIAIEVGDGFARAMIALERGSERLSSEDFASARIQFQKALQVFRGLNDRLYMALTMALLGRVALASGDIATAVREFESALDNNREIGNRFAESDSLYNLAQARKASGNIFEALGLVEASIRMSETLRGSITGSRLRTSYYSSIGDRFEFYINLLMGLHQKDPGAGYDARALAASEQSRARSLADSLQLGDTELTADDDLVRRGLDFRLKLLAKSDELAAAVSSGEPQDRIKLLNGEIDRLTLEYEQQRTDLVERRSATHPSENGSSFDLDQYRSKVLRHDSLLLEFFLGEDQSYLWVVGEAGISAFTLPGRGVIEEKGVAISSLLIDREIRSGENLEGWLRRMEAAEVQFRRDGQDLSNMLLGKAASQLAGKRLIFVPSGALNYVPFAALPQPSEFESAHGANPPLVASNEIGYAPSASVQLLRVHQQRRPPGKGVLVLADPIFSDKDPRLGTASNMSNTIAVLEQLPTRGEPLDGGSLARLPETMRESQTIYDRLDSANVTLLSGADATREKLFASHPSDYRVVHFATHAIVDERAPELSAIVLSMYDGEGNPSNGRLLLNDIYRLQLASDLVVLSACRTGAGKETRGEGVMGLTRGFLVSGSRSVLGTLWKVDDSATAEFMNHYYSALLDENRPPADALRKAQLAMLDNPRWKSPFYWAAFTLNGEFRDPIASKIERPQRSYLWALFVFLAGGVLAFFFRARIARLFRGLTHGETASV